VSVADGPRGLEHANNLIFSEHSVANGYRS
jgi:hypothetical protein